MNAPAYDEGNVFAKILRGELPCHKLFEDKDTLAFMDVMPRGRGHCLVIPKKPARNILDVDAESLASTIATVQKLAKAVIPAFAADGVTIHQFNEQAGGQVVCPLHFNVLPRFDGEPLGPPTSTMEKPEALAANAERIRGALGA